MAGMSDSQPNILFIISDQMRTEAVGAWGNPLIKTPTLDRLASEGTSFRRAYTPSPVCSPARAAFCSGVAPHVAQKVENLPGLRDEWAGYAELLSKAGYQSCRIGGEPLSGRPRLIDGYQTKHTNSDYAAWFKEQGIDHVAEPGGRSAEYYMMPQTMSFPDQYSKDHWLCDRAIDFVNEREKSKPFVIEVNFAKPHPPYPVPYPWQYLYRAPEMPYPIRPANYKHYQCRANRYQNRYKWMETAVAGDDMLLRTIRAAYYSLCSWIDWLTGRLLESLGDELDNTLVFFTADHGEMLGDYGCAGKRCMLEGAVRVPLLVRYPKGFAAGKDCRAAASTLDIMPTMLEAAGLEIPAYCEGRSLSEVAEMQPGERIVHSQHSRMWNGQYFAADGATTYWHSAADRREWAFHVGDSLEQGPILPVEGRAAELKQACLERWEGDRFSDAVNDDGSDWKEHEAPPNRLETDPDYGLLMAEDHEKIQADLDALPVGYHRRIDPKAIAKGHPMAEHLKWSGPEEKAELAAWVEEERQKPQSKFIV